MLGIKEAMRIALAVRPDMRSCEEELHGFVFYDREEFYGDSVVVLKEDGRIVDFYDGYLCGYRRGAPRAKYVFNGDVVSVMRFHYCPRDFDRWETPPNGAGIELLPFEPERVAVIRQINQEFAAAMDAKKRRRQRHRPRWRF